MLTNLKSPVLHSVYRRDLKQKIAASQQQIRENIAINNAKTIHRTQAINRKCPYESMEKEQTARQAILAEQIKTWRRLLPQLLMKFSRIPDPRRSKSIKHQLVVLMIFGLFAFVFRLSSRREMNRELTGAAVTTNLRKLFPELDSIPHADTLARLLEKINSARIESAHIELIKKLIRGKKLNKVYLDQENVKYAKLKFHLESLWVNQNRENVLLTLSNESVNSPVYLVLKFLIVLQKCH